MAVTHHLATGRLAGVLALACFVSDTAFAVDLSVAKEPLEYECRAVRSVGLTEYAAGEVTLFDQKADLTKASDRYVIRRFSSLNKLAAPIVRKVDDESGRVSKLTRDEIDLFSSWSFCGSGKAPLGLLPGAIDFCVAHYKQFESDRFVYLNSEYCQSATKESLSKDYPREPNYSAISCSTSIFDTDKLIRLQLLKFFNNSLGIEYQKCIRLDR